MNALILMFVALCVFSIAYRFYGLFIANKVLNSNLICDTNTSGRSLCKIK